MKSTFVAIHVGWRGFSCAGVQHSRHTCVGESVEVQLLIWRYPPSTEQRGLCLFLSEKYTAEICWGKGEEGGGFLIIIDAFLYWKMSTTPPPPGCCPDIASYQSLKVMCKRVRSRAEAITLATHTHASLKQLPPLRPVQATDVVTRAYTRSICEGW